MGPSDLKKRQKWHCGRQKEKKNSKRLRKQKRRKKNRRNKIEIFLMKRGGRKVKKINVLIKKSRRRKKQTCFEFWLYIIIIFSKKIVYPTTRTVNLKTLLSYSLFYS